MAHNARIRADIANGANPWVLGKPIVQAECQAFDDAQYKSVNGDAGGTWNPSSLITIGGQGVKLTGVATVANCTAFTLTSFTIEPAAYFTLGADMTFGAGSASFIQNNATVNASAQIVCNGPVTVRAQSNWLINGSIVGTASFVGVTTNVKGGSVVNFSAGTLALTQGSLTTGPTPTVTLSGNQTFAATSALTVANRVRLSGSGATTRWRVGTGSDSNSNYDCAKDLYRVPTITGARIYTLLDATAGIPPVEGSRITFSIAATGAFSLTFKREDGSTAALLSDCNFGGFVSFTYRDGAWHARTWNDP